MVLKVTIQCLCGPCDDDPATENTPATHSETITIDGMPSIIDVCDRHSQQIQMIRKFVSNYGRAPESEPISPVARAVGAPPRAREQRQQLALPESEPERIVPCFICRKTFRTTGTFNTHFEIAHGIRPSLFWPSPLHCPVCGREAPNAQGLGSHVRHAHEASGVTGAILWARDHDDPHGVYAEIMEILESRKEKTE